MKKQLLSLLLITTILIPNLLNATDEPPAMHGAGHAIAGGGTAGPGICRKSILSEADRVVAMSGKPVIKPIYIYSTPKSNTFTGSVHTLKHQAVATERPFCSCWYSRIVPATAEPVEPPTRTTATEVGLPLVLYRNLSRLSSYTEEDRPTSYNFIDFHYGQAHESTHKSYALMVNAEQKVFLVATRKTDEEAKQGIQKLEVRDMFEYLPSGSIQRVMNPRVYHHQFMTPISWRTLSIINEDSLNNEIIEKTLRGIASVRIHHSFFEYDRAPYEVLMIITETGPTHLAYLRLQQFAPASPTGEAAPTLESPGKAESL